MYSNTTATTTNTNYYSNKGLTAIQLTATATCTKCDQMAVEEETAKRKRNSNGEFKIHTCIAHLTMPSIFASSHRIPNTTHTTQHQAKSTEARKRAYVA